MLRLVMQFFVKKILLCTQHAYFISVCEIRGNPIKSQEFVSFLYSLVDHMVGLDSAALHHRLKARYVNTRF